MDDDYYLANYRQVCRQVPLDPDKPGDPGNHPSDYDHLSPAKQAALRYWISKAIPDANRINRTRSSYGIKHDFEAEGFYITNGQFKGAMLLQGFSPDSARDLNWYFRIGKPPATRTVYTLGRFDKKFMQLLLVACPYLAENPTPPAA